MNEVRIRELAQQAGLKMIHDETLALGYLNTPTKKFAELIIKECAEIALREDHDPSDCILGHFGIKR